MLPVSVKSDVFVKYENTLYQTPHGCMSSEIQKSSIINPCHTSSLFGLLQLAPECNLHCLKVVCEVPL